MTTERTLRGSDRIVATVMNALEDLLVDEGMRYRDISATTLCKRAGISRQTFYRYFSNVDDVLTALARRYAEKLSLAMSLYSGEELADFKRRTTHIFEFFGGLRPLLRSLKQSHALSQFLSALWESFGNSWIPAELVDDDKRRMQFARYSLGAYSAAIEDWVDEEDASPTEMAGTLEELVMAMPSLVGKLPDGLMPDETASLDATEHS